MEVARKYAMKHKMEPYKYHLIPRTKGFKVCLPVLKKYCDSICTIDICFEEDHSEISGANLFQGMKFNAAGLMKRIPMSIIPEGIIKLNLKSIRLCSHFFCFVYVKILMRLLNFC
jgi:lysophosphatidic acid acyltransferase/lysophosphatidylinositol acyltransferase